MIRVIGLLAGYVFTYIIASKFGAGANGLVSLAFTLMLFSVILSRLGIDTNLVKFYSDENNRNDIGLFYKVLIKAIVFSLFISLALIGFKDVISTKLFDMPKLRPYVIWAAMTVPFWTITLICGGLFRALKKNKLFSFFNNPGRFIFSLVAFGILLLYVQDPIAAIKAHFYGVMLLSLTALSIAVRTLNGFTITSKTNSWEFIREAFPMMISGAIIVFLGWADTFILGIYETDAVIGVYNVSLKIAALTSFTLQAINSILGPKIARSYANNNHTDFKSMIKFSTRINFVLTLIIVSGIVVFHRLILGFFGEEFLTGANILILLCLGQLINSLSGSVGLIMQMIGLQKAYQNIVLMALFINIVLNLILTPIHGAIGAAVATVVSIAFWNITGAIYLKHKKGIISYFSIK